MLFMNYKLFCINQNDPTQTFNVHCRLSVRCTASDPPPAPAVRFVDATVEAGIDFVHTSGRSGRKYGVETIGSGAAFFDYNRDGWMDLYVVNGADLPGYVSAVLPKNALYRNDGGHFAEVGASLGVADAGYGMGASAGGLRQRRGRRPFRGQLWPQPALSQRGAAFADVTTVVGIGRTSGGQLDRRLPITTSMAT